MDDVDGLDELINDIGTTKWSFIIFITSSLIPGILPPNLIGGEFLNPIPQDFVCIEDNSTECSWINEANETTACHEWAYDTSMFHSTVAMEWNLVCDDAFWQPLYQIFYTVGCLFGSLLGGYVANCHGRKVAIQLGTIFTVVCSLTLVVAPYLSLVLILRFILGIFNTMMIYPGFMLSMEICTCKLRSIVGVVLAIPYALNIMIFSGMAYGIRDWRWLQLASCVFLPFLAIGSFLIDESPRWLLVNGQVEKATTVINNAAKYSKKTFSTEDLEKKIQDINKELSFKNKEKDNKLWSTVASLFTHSEMRRITLLLVVIWLLQGVVYLGIPLNADNFSSPFLYMTLMGVMELPAYSITAPITKRLGRRAVAGTSLLITGVGILCIVVLHFCNVIIDALDLSITLISYLFVCTAYQVNFLYAPELFPTTVRPYGTALTNLLAYIGYSIPPIITDYLGDDLPLLPPIVFGCCGLFSGILVFFLPETNNLPLMETLADLTHRTHNK